jgi:hypothetical protein
MRDERTRTPAEEDATIDSAVLGLMIGAADQRPCSRDEIDRAIGEDTTDSLNRLHAAGLIHRLAGFAWATRAAIAAEELRI